MKFPAAHLSAYDVGRRIRAVSLTGAIVTDILTGIKVSIEHERGQDKRLILSFQSVMHSDAYGRGGFEVALDSLVKRIAA